MKIIFCTLIEDRKRVDMYLVTVFSDFSRSYIQKIIDKGEVSINGKIISKNLKIKNKDLIVIDIKVEKNEKVEAEDLNLDVVFEDDNILILNKEAGVNTHPVPGEGGNSNTLVNGVLFHCKEKLPVISGEERPGIVHRLDKDTSGAIMIAKNDNMMHYLQTLFKERKNISKYYLAIVHGIVKNPEFKIESYIGRDPNNRLKMTTVNSLNPKIAISHGKVLGYIENKFSLVKIKIETGRTHQIRVHMASIGHFILGDTTYGNPKINIEMKTRYQLKRQALHAYNLKLKLYEKDESFIAPLKDDMKKMIPEELLKLI